MTESKGRTWKDLEAEGVKRCAMWFSGGQHGPSSSQCRRRGVVETENLHGGMLCAKHAPAFKSAVDAAELSMKEEG